MKIALFVHCFYPEHFYGTETYTLQVAQTLQHLGHEVTVVCGVFQGEPIRDALLTDYIHDGVPVIAIDKNYRPHESIEETYFQEAMREPLREVLQRLSPDIVHVTHLVNHTAVLLEVVQSLRIPLVATLTDFFGFCYNSKLEAADGSLCAGPNALRSNCLACHVRAVAETGNVTAARVARLPFGHAAAGLAMRLLHSARLRRSSRLDAIVPDIVRRPQVLLAAYGAYEAMIAPTTFLRDAYVGNGFDPKRLTLSHFGVDIDRRPKPARPSGHRLTIGFIGQLSAHKGTLLLIEAARALPEGSVRIVIHGPPNQDPAYMERLRQTAGPETSFRGVFEPRLMADVMAELDVLCIPSTWYENSPLVLLNALATHTPVLVSDVRGLTEFIEPGVNGWSFERGNVSDLTRVLKDLVARPQDVINASKKTHYERSIADMGADVERLHRRVFETRAHEPRARLAAPSHPMKQSVVTMFTPAKRLDAAQIEQQSLIAPFPPRALMQRVSGLTNDSDFASHGRDIFCALQAASPKPLQDHEDILDFGVGSGRLARMFAGFKGNYVGADIDHELLSWAARNLPWLTPLATEPRKALPSPDGSFDCVISISVFTHMNQADCAFYLGELQRLTRPGACLMLTVHGERSLRRAETEASIFHMLSISRDGLRHARRSLDAGGFEFILQQGHLTTASYDYGITFMSEAFVRANWTSGFTVENVISGAIHDFQDIVVLRRQL